MEKVAAFDKIWDSRFDGELHFADDFVVESQVQKDIVCSWTKPVLYSNYFQFLRSLTAYSLNLFVDLKDLLLPRWALAPEKVADFKCQEVWRVRP